MLLKRIFRDRHAAEDNLHISSSNSFNLHSTSLIVQTSACVASVWVCKHCAKSRPGTGSGLLWYMRWYHQSPTVPLFNYRQRRRGGRWRGRGRAILMKMGHVIKVDLTRFIRSSGSRTVNTEIKWTVPLTAANTQDKIRLHGNCFYPTDGKWGRE